MRMMDWSSDVCSSYLLCRHGFPTASWDWHRLWPALTATRRVIALDFLGYGFSSKPEHHTYSAAEQADIVLALMQELGVRQAHVLAHDFGDSVAQGLLAREIGSASGRERGCAYVYNTGVADSLT